MTAEFVKQALSEYKEGRQLILYTTIQMGRGLESSDSLPYKWGVWGDDHKMHYYKMSKIEFTGEGITFDYEWAIGDDRYWSKARHGYAKVYLPFSSILGIQVTNPHPVVATY